MTGVLFGCCRRGGRLLKQAKYKVWIFYALNVNPSIKRFRYYLKKESVYNNMVSSADWALAIIADAGAVEGVTRLQKYAFLVILFDSKIVNALVMRASVGLNVLADCM